VRKEWIEGIACPARDRARTGWTGEGKRAGKLASFFLLPHRTYALVHDRTSFISLRTSPSTHMDVVRGKGWDLRYFKATKTTGNAAEGGNEFDFSDGLLSACPFVLLKCIRRCALVCVGM